jgi:ubiquinone/menaquinone biosynthesis C-methylase UbiE
MNKNQDYVLQNRDAYDNFADLFSDTRDYPWVDYAFIPDYLEENAKVLDIGSGNGRLSEIINLKTENYTGIDISLNLVKIAKERYPNGNFLVGDMRELPFSDGEFDVLVAVASFCHILKKDQFKTMKEWSRILKPNGVLVMLNWNMQGDYVLEKIEKKQYLVDNETGGIIVPFKIGSGEVLGDRVYYSYTIEELRELGRRSGFELERAWYSRNGEVSNIALGKNIVTIFNKM